VYWNISRVGKLHGEGEEDTMHEKETNKQASQNSHHNKLPLAEQPMISHVLKKKTGDKR
jgi:hypothetical protein